MANLIPNIKQKFFDANGLPLNGGKLYSYAAGTTTPQATYTDASEATPNTNPIILNANGEADIWLRSLSYKFTLTDSADVELWTVDNVVLISLGAITTTKLADGSVTTVKIADLAVTSAKLGVASVITTKIADSNVTTAKINDGAVTTAKLNDTAVTPAKINDSVLQTLFIERNKIINGDMDYWQRSGFTPSFPAIANGAFSADRWQFRKSGTMVYGIDQELTIVPTLAQAGITFNASMKISCTTALTPLISGSLTEITQPIEGFFFRDITLKSFVFTFWIYSSKTGKLCVAFKNSTTFGLTTPTKSYVSEFTISAANTWEKKTIVVPAPTSGTWNSVYGCGLSANLVLSCGSTYQTTAGVWQNGNYSGTSTMDNFSDLNTNVMYVTGFRLEGGAVARAYESRHPSIELLLCKRYFEVIGAYFPAYNTNVAASLALGGALHYQMEKAGTATVYANNLTCNSRCNTPSVLPGGQYSIATANLITGSAGVALLSGTVSIEAEIG